MTNRYLEEVIALLLNKLLTLQNKKATIEFEIEKIQKKLKKLNHLINKDVNT